MIIRQTGIEELEEVMRIYERAARFMAETGNPNQWAPGYPPREMIADDIQRGVSYVMEENGCVEAVFSYIEGSEPTYGRIVNGAWRSQGAYATVHRLASAGRQRGIARQCFAWCGQQAALHGCRSLRADTHMDNKVMQHALVQNGFAYCGNIYLANGAPRLAYERLLWQGEGTFAGNYQQTQQSQKGDGIAFGITSMVLGIVSLLLFCTCINFVTAIAAIVFGIVQIVKNKEKAFAVAGIITAAISLVLGLILWGIVAAGMAETGINSYEEFYDSYYDGYYDNDDYYDSYDGYYDGYYDDYYDDYDGYYDDYYDYYDDYNEYYEEESGAEFL